MALFNKDEVDKNEQNYIDTVEDLAKTEETLANEIDYNKDADTAFEKANVLAKQKAEQEAAKQAELNTLNNTSKMATAISNTEASDRANVMSEQYKEKMNQIQAQRDEKNKMIIAAKQRASEEAKLKYEESVQRYNQSKTNLINIATTLMTLGVTIAAL